MYKLKFTKQAKKDAKIAERGGYRGRIDEICDTIERDPFEQSHEFEKLVNMKDVYTRRVNYHNRFVYKILPNAENLKDANNKHYDGVIKVVRMWGHYP